MYLAALVEGEVRGDDRHQVLLGGGAVHPRQEALVRMRLAPHRERVDVAHETVPVVPNQPPMLVGLMVFSRFVTNQPPISAAASLESLLLPFTSSHAVTYFIYFMRLLILFI